MMNLQLIEFVHKYFSPSGFTPLKVTNIKLVFDKFVFVNFEHLKINIEFDIEELYAV